MNPSPKEGFLADTPRNLFFTGKGGVGKTSSPAPPLWL